MRILALSFAVAALLQAAIPCAAADLRATVRDRMGRGVEDAVVLAVPLDRSLMKAVRPARNVVDQVGQEFVPYVKPVYVDSMVSFPNKDNIRHHVYSFSPAKTFELKLYSGTAAPPVLFDVPGAVTLGCNIHDWMIGYIYVADTPFFAKTDKDGVAEIERLPAGEYNVRVWHPDMEESEQATAKHLSLGVQTANVEWSLPVKAPARIPRPIGGAEFGYR